MAGAMRGGVLCRDACRAVREEGSGTAGLLAIALRRIVSGGARSLRERIEFGPCPLHRPVAILNVCGGGTLSFIEGVGRMFPGRSKSETTQIWLANKKRNATFLTQPWSLDRISESRRSRIPVFHTKPVSGPLCRGAAVDAAAIAAAVAVVVIAGVVAAILCRIIIGYFELDAIFSG